MLFKCDEENFLEINVLGRKYPDTNNYWDINFLDVGIQISVAGFKADYLADLRTDEFQRFYNELVQLKDNIGNKAEFSSSEEGLYLSCTLRRTGRIDCKGVAKDFSGNKLEFSFSTDNQVLYDVLNQLECLLKDYPVIGTP